jgi:hypothetical protein
MIESMSEQFDLLSPLESSNTSSRATTTRVMAFSFSPVLV